MVYVSSDSASCSETDEEPDDTVNKLPPSREVALNQSKQFPLQYQLVLDNNQIDNKSIKIDVSTDNKGDKSPTIVYKPRSGRLRPYPYIASTNFDQPSGNHEEVMPPYEIEKKLKSISPSNTGLICLEEHAYIEFKPTKWPLERRSGFQHEPTSLGDLGPKFSKILKNKDAETTTTTAGKKKKGEKDKNKSKSEQSTDTIEEIDEKSRQIYSLCDSMPNIMPSIRCFECKDLVKSSSFPRHVFDHIITDKQAFPPDDNHNWCAHCNRCFKSDLELRDHYMMVKRFGRYFCMFCIKKFKNTEERFVHFRTNHFCQNTPYVCPVCPYKSSIEINFTSHYVESHPLPICHLCHHLFPNARGLFFSNYRTSFERQRDGYNLYREILNHMKQHIDFGETFACNMCTLTFISAADLISHQKATHTNIALNVKKMPLSHTGFAYRVLVVSGEALSQLEFYKNEERLMKFVGPYRRKVITASNASRSHVQHANRRNARRSENVEDLNMQENEEEGERENEREEGEGEGILPIQVDNNEDQVTFKFKDCFFDTQTAAKCLQDHNFNVEAFFERIKCNSCQKYIKPSRKSNAESIHFSKEAIRCSFSDCTQVSHCHLFMKLHQNFHKVIPKCKVGTEMLLPDQFPNKDDLMICSNCELYFDTFTKQNSHMKDKGHIGYFHSFKRDTYDEKSQKRNKINWLHELGKIQRNLNN